jgi:membrane-bound lytic murein transglycosylase D
VVALPFYADVPDLERNLGVSRETIAELNPALRPPVFRSGKRIPKGYALRLPAGTVVGDASTWLAAVPKESRHADQHQNRYYTVRRGDTLGRIAARNRTTVAALVAENDIGRRHKIYPGQVLQMPDRGGRPAPLPKESIELVKTAVAATLPPAKPDTAPAPAPQAAQPAPEAAPAIAPEPTPTPAPEPIVAEVPAPETELAPAPVIAAVAPQDVEIATEASIAPPAPVETEVEIASISEIAATSAPVAVLAAAPDDSPFRRIDRERVIVDTDETLGHFAEWLEVTRSAPEPEQASAAGHPGRPDPKLDFSKVSPGLPGAPARVPQGHRRGLLRQLPRDEHARPHAAARRVALAALAQEVRGAHLADPPLQPRRRPREALARHEARDPDRGEGVLA